MGLSYIHVFLVFTYPHIFVTLNQSTNLVTKQNKKEVYPYNTVPVGGRSVPETSVG